MYDNSDVEHPIEHDGLYTIDFYPVNSFAVDYPSNSMNDSLGSIYYLGWEEGKLIGYDLGIKFWKDKDVLKPQYICDILNSFTDHIVSINKYITDDYEENSISKKYELDLGESIIVYDMIVKYERDNIIKNVNLISPDTAISILTSIYQYILLNKKVIHDLPIRQIICSVINNYLSNRRIEEDRYSNNYPFHITLSNSIDNIDIMFYIKDIIKLIKLDSFRTLKTYEYIHLRAYQMLFDSIMETP